LLFKLVLLNPSPEWVKTAVLEIPDIRSCTVDLVFDPPWDPSRMSDEFQLFQSDDEDVSEHTSHQRQACDMITS
jgi:metal-sulfur cluster biosynthetic enzyme